MGESVGESAARRFDSVERGQCALLSAGSHQPNCHQTVSPSRTNPQRTQPPAGRWRTPSPPSALYPSCNPGIHHISTNMTPSVLLCFLSLSAVTAINLEPGRSKPVRLFSVKRKFINSARTRLQLQDSKTARKILKRRIKLRKPSPSVSKSTQNKSNGISDSVIENINR